MQLLKTNSRKGQTISTLITNLWQEYQSIGYPKDPNCYFIRANKQTRQELLEYEDGHRYKHDHKRPLPAERFLWFAILEDNRLADREILFGPEVTEIKWIKE